LLSLIVDFSVSLVFTCLHRLRCLNSHSPARLSVLSELCTVWAHCPFLFVHVRLPGADAEPLPGLRQGLSSTFGLPCLLCTAPRSTQHPYGTGEFGHPRTAKYLGVFSTVPAKHRTPRKRWNPCYQCRLCLSTTLLWKKRLSSLQVFSSPVRILSSLLEWNSATYLAPQHQQLNTRRPALPSLLWHCTEEWGTVPSRALQSARGFNQRSTSPIPALARMVVQKPCCVFFTVSFWLARVFCTTEHCRVALLFCIKPGQKAKNISGVKQVWRGKAGRKPMTRIQQSDFYQPGIHF